MQRVRNDSRHFKYIAYMVQTPTANIYSIKAASRTSSYKLICIHYNHNELTACHPTDGCDDKTCGFRQQCQTSNRGLVCSCPRYLCDGKLNPVCGSDGETHNSLCHLRRHECTTSRYVGVQHLGACIPKPTSNYTVIS